MANFITHPACSHEYNSTKYSRRPATLYEVQLADVRSKSVTPTTQGNRLTVEQLHLKN
jgi:hypothetical protein